MKNPKRGGCTCARVRALTETHKKNEVLEYALHKKLRERAKNSSESGLCSVDHSLMPLDSEGYPGRAVFGQTIRSASPATPAAGNTDRGENSSIGTDWAVKHSSHVGRRFSMLIPRVVPSREFLLKG